MDASITTTNDTCIVIHFNAFTGKLEGGYLASHARRTRIGSYLLPAAILAYMAANPDVRCKAMNT